MREHTPGERAAKLEQARPAHRGWQRRAVPGRLPALEEEPGQPFELGPQRVFTGRRKIQFGGDRGGNAELGRTPVLRHGQIPGKRVVDRSIVPDAELGQSAQGASGRRGTSLMTSRIRAFSGSEMCSISWTRCRCSMAITTTSSRLSLWATNLHPGMTEPHS